MPAEQQSYDSVSADYFAKRGLRRYAGVASLWALGVGAVISGHHSGWNLGLMAGGWGGFALAGAGRGVRDGKVSSSCRPRASGSLMIHERARCARSGRRRQ